MALLINRQSPSFSFTIITDSADGNSIYQFDLWNTPSPSDDRIHKGRVVNQQVLGQFQCQSGSTSFQSRISSIDYSRPSTSFWIVDMPQLSMNNLLVFIQIPLILNFWRFSNSLERTRLPVPVHFTWNEHSLNWMWGCRRRYPQWETIS